MEKILDFEFLDNSVEDYLYVLGISLLVFFIKTLISRFIAGKLLSLIIGKTKHLKKDTFLSLVIKPIEKFLLAFICITALDRLYFPNKFHFKVYQINSEEIVRSFAICLMVILFIRLCIKVIEFISILLEEKANLTNDVAGNQLIVFFKDFFKVILILLGILLILHFAFHRNIGNMFTGLSIVGAAMALAARESLENLIASFIIFFDKPFIVGNTVKVGNITGAIEKIGLRSTRIRTEQKTFVSVPNKQMVDTILDNLSLRTQRRVELNIEIGLKTTSKQLEELSSVVNTLIQSNTSIENFAVYISDTGKKAHILTVEYFSTMEQSIQEFYLLKQTINLEIIEKIESMQLEFAALVNEVTLKKETV